MNLQNFKEVYTKIITESTDDSELKQYIKTIVEEVLNEKNEDGISDAEFYGIDSEKHEKMYGMSKKSKVFNLGLKPSDKTLQTIIDRHAKNGFILKGESGVLGEDNTGIEVTYNDYTKEYAISGVEFHGGDVDSSEEIGNTKDIDKLLKFIKNNYNSWIK